MTIAQTIAEIQQTLPESVRLIAVTKQVSVAQMREAYAAGVRDFGENRLQDAIAKQDRLQDLTDVTWHFIGHLQSNKAKTVLERFHWIHSVDRLSLAQQLQHLSERGAPARSICLQVKLRPDPNKSGWTEPELLADLPALDRCSHLNVRGLMTIAPLGLTASELTALFRDVRQLTDRIQTLNYANIHMQHRSMGMSDDYQLAIREGATMVRLGRILFGSTNQ
jgi:PLP dependent protein